jgi:hypothetical protein
MKKIISLFLSAVVLSTLLISCGDKAVKMPKPENSMTVFTLGGKKINYDYVRYVYLNTKADMEYGEEEGYWENNAAAFDELKQSTLSMIVHNRAIEMLAEKYKLTLTEAEKKAVAKLLNETKKDKEGWKEAKEDYYFTEYSFSYLQRFSILWGKTYDHVTSPTSGIIKSDDETVLADIPINFRNIRYVYIEYDETNKAQKQALAEEILAKANGGEDFVKLIKDYGEDTTMANFINIGYYYTVGSINSAVEMEAEKLAVNGVSPIIDVKDGFFIVQRIDIDMEYAKKNVSVFLEYYLGRRFNEMVADIESEMTTELSDFWNNLKLDDIK